MRRLSPMPATVWRAVSAEHDPENRSAGFPATSCRRPREFREASGDCAIDLAPERHHEIGDPIEAFPSPCVEFGRLAVARRQRIDLLVASEKAQREPFLPLAAEFREPMRRPV